jgi:hypothetical protein
VGPEQQPAEQVRRNRGDTQPVGGETEAAQEQHGQRELRQRHVDAIVGATVGAVPKLAALSTTI